MEVRSLSDVNAKLSSKLSITKNVNTLLSKPKYSNVQYSRRQCLDIVGIPRKVSWEVIEVLNI